MSSKLRDFALSAFCLSLRGRRRISPARPPWRRRAPIPRAFGKAPEAPLPPYAAAESKNAPQHIRAGRFLATAPRRLHRRSPWLDRAGAQRELRARRGRGWLIHPCEIGGVSSQKGRVSRFCRSTLKALRLRRSFLMVMSGSPSSYSQTPDLKNRVPERPSNNNINQELF